MELSTELDQIPGALTALVDYYEGPGRQALHIPSPRQALLTGMGASYHAARIGAFMLQDAGIAAQAVETADLLFSLRYDLRPFQSILYISQSGRSGEVQPFLDRLDEPKRLAAITNEAGSPLAEAAGSVLPLVAGQEQWIAGKTYINALAVLWLLSARWSQRDPARPLDELRAVAARMDWLRARSGEAAAYLEESFASFDQVVFLGHGPHAVTAREAAMTLSEWPKLASQSYSVAAFRHGFIEAVDARTAVTIFSAPGPSRPSALALGSELAAYGARVGFIENGLLRDPEQPPQGPDCPHELLSPLLDILPVQLFAEAAARRRFDRPGFRYLSKVVTKR